MWQSLVETWRNLNREQKVSVVLLSICGFFALGLSLYRVQANVYAPFLVDKSAILAAKKIVGPTPAEVDAKKKRTDTDGDGLSDWDEENVYHTNPNLRDSCGDGIPDNIRVITGKNLNCAANQPTSSGVGNGEASGTGTASGVMGLSPIYSNVVNSGLTNPAVVPQGTVNAAAVDPSGSQNMAQTLPRDPQMIRQALKGKVDQTKLDAMSDADLLKSYDEALATQQTTQQGAGSASSTTN